MADALIALLPNCSEHIASKKETRQLSKTLEKGCQTDGREHFIIASMLKISLTLYHQPDFTTKEVITDFGPGSRQANLALHEKSDGAGCKQGHFDLLLPESLVVPEGPVVPTREADLMSVSQCITVKGPEIAAALLQGCKDIENRKYCLEGSWVGIHLGKGEQPAYMKAYLQEVAPGISTEGFEKGMIVGMVFFSKSMSLEEYRKSMGCSFQCHFSASGTWKSAEDLPRHHPSCRCSRHALGPILNIVKHRVLFKKPIPATGSLGKWALPCETADLVRKLLKEEAYTITHSDGSIPQDVQTFIFEHF